MKNIYIMEAEQYYKMRYINGRRKGDNEWAVNAKDEIGKESAGPIFRISKYIYKH